MQNKKGLTTVLLIVVGLIWGLVFYRIFSGMDSGSGNSGISKKVAFIAPEKIEEDTFTLTLKYRDPFLGKSEQASFTSSNYSNNDAPVISKPKAVIAPKEKPPEVAMDWSFIRYIGSVKNQATGKQVALISIRDKEDVLEEGMTKDGVKILHRTKDSVEVEYTGLKKWIRR